MRRLRERLELNRAEFARLVGVDARTVLRWEDATGPRPKGSAAHVLTGIAEHLERSPRNAERVVKLLVSAAAIGGLAYLLTKLLDNAAD